MKLRSLICVSAVAAASAALALDSGNVFARLKVTSDVENSIIAIPFAGCGESTAEIYVTNLVMTAGLATGDTLMYNNGTAWYAWEIQDGQWVAVAAGTKNGVTVAAPQDFKMASGGACWLMRNTAASCYLYGQVNETKPSSVTVAGAASDNAVAYTIIAKPDEAAALDLNTWKDKGMGNGDTLLVPVPDATSATGQKTYKYDGTAKAWAQMTTSTVEVTNPRTKQKSTVTQTSWTPITSSVTIPAGQGVMYGRKGTSSATLQW